MEQLEWLGDVLEKASRKNQKVIIFCHFPVYPQDPHNLWNSEQVIELIEDYNCVKAYLNGHNHKGNYGTRSGIHFLTMKGMVDTNENAYGVITIRNDTLYVTGFGREENRDLILRE